MAVMAGVQTALIGLLRRFVPTLEEQHRAGPLGSLLPVARKARCWELFRTTYKDIAREAEDDFKLGFGREFARAYERRRGGSDATVHHPRRAAAVAACSAPPTAAAHRGRAHADRDAGRQSAAVRPRGANQGAPVACASTSWLDQPGSKGRSSSRCTTRTRRLSGTDLVKRDEYPGPRPDQDH